MHYWESLPNKTIEEAALKAAINATGYEVKGITSEPYEKKKGIFSFLHKCVQEAGVAPASFNRIK